jgi:hypothetical protein
MPNAPDLFYVRDRGWQEAVSKANNTLLSPCVYEQNIGASGGGFTPLVRLNCIRGPEDDGQMLVSKQGK